MGITLNHLQLSILQVLRAQNLFQKLKDLISSFFQVLLPLALLRDQFSRKLLQELLYLLNMNEYLVDPGSGQKFRKII